MGETTLNLEPLDATFGAIIRDIELSAISDGLEGLLHEAWIEYALLIFPGQFLTRPEQDDFARRFGDLEFEAAPITNIDGDGRVRSDSQDDVIKSLRGNQGWHHDSTYMPRQAKASVFSAEIVPASGAPTAWADMRAAYDALDDATRNQIEELSAYHSLYYSQERAGYLPTPNKEGGYDMYGYHDLTVSLRPLVKIHPETGRPNLLIGRHAYGIPGMDETESQGLLNRLSEGACRPPRLVEYQWTAGDAVLWDNRRLMHRGIPFDMTQPRRMWHTRIAGDVATEMAANHA
ncbi:MAG: TauD/TfdA family dioxygenase [Myxococcales bacterium]|nr:TauD/TfdA family dioxygenase [Myxococcales bacterium]HIK83670.1 TauD/TfdA family dioxygenase [Myxococcales bacterium]